MDFPQSAFLLLILMFCEKIIYNVITLITLMKEMKYPRKYMIEKRKTTITVKLRTKYRLDEYKESSESYDDTIIRLLSELERLRREREQQKMFIRDNFGEIPNRIEFQEFRRSKRALNLMDMTVFYTYNKPPEIPPPEGYMFGIEMEEIRDTGTTKGYSFDKLHPKEVMDIYLLIISDLIRRYLDKTYYPPLRVNIIDRHYWERIFNKYGLPWTSYQEDIVERIDQFENEMNELERKNG